MLELHKAIAFFKFLCLVLMGRPYVAGEFMGQRHSTKACVSSCKRQQCIFFVFNSYGKLITDLSITSLS
jgi:hypothetical protein